uniref:Uncharacterized protein n=1 Tax=viral metagenome TaxID=1070528 RepID=A0A6C0ANE1_9ZZZZ
MKFSYNNVVLFTILVGLIGIVFLSDIFKTKVLKGNEKLAKVFLYITVCIFIISRIMDHLCFESRSCYYGR